jgi:hypothetical protein
VATDSGTNVYFDDVANWPMVHEAYVRAMKAEISKMLEVIPADDLLIQLDLAWEVVDLSIGDEQYFPWWPESTLDQKFERYMNGLVQLAAAVPENVPLGLHWCYGTWGGWPMTEIKFGIVRAAVERGRQTHQAPRRLRAHAGSPRS